jgi:4'-phosphopantetheinyl transferase EntD
MIERLLPPEVAAVAMRGDDSAARALPEEEALLGEAVQSRRAEFAAARHCARQALGRLGLREAPILRGAKREPLWPPGIVGSITHCTGYRAAAVGRAMDVLTIGIDAEPHAPVPDRVARRILVEAESAWIATAPRDIHWDRLIFSAKESVYKAWYPLAQRWLGFEDASVTIDRETCAFHARLLIEPPPSLPRAFDGRYLIEDGLVVTAIVARHQA